MNGHGAPCLVFRGNNVDKLPAPFATSLQGKTEVAKSVEHGNNSKKKKTREQKPDYSAAFPVW
jgi:hypothetical protein